MSAEGLSYHVVRVWKSGRGDGEVGRWTGYEFVCACVRVLKITYKSCDHYILFFRNQQLKKQTKQNKNTSHSIFLILTVKSVKS